MYVWYSGKTLEVMIANINWTLYVNHCSEHLTTSITSLIICVTRHILLALSHCWGIWAGHWGIQSSLQSCETVEWGVGLMVWLWSQLIITTLPVFTVHPPFGGRNEKHCQDMLGGRGGVDRALLLGTYMFSTYCLWSFRLGVLFAGKPLSFFSIMHMSSYNQETQ